MPGVTNFSAAQLMKLNNYSTPACLSVIKELGLLRRSRYIHRSSRRKFVFSRCGDAIPSVWSAVRPVASLPRHRSADTLWTCSSGTGVAATALLMEPDARSSGCGGGLAVMYRSHLALSPLPLPELSSVECLAFNSKYPHPMTVLLIYRPPKPNPRFIQE
ncbi:uncharacterized protein AKAME5_001359900, partial [Lates japonicus]